MYHSMTDGSGWVWMTLVTVALIAVVGAVVYAAVRLANQTSADGKADRKV